MSGASSSPRQEPVRLAYIAGAGRSGSTVLDLMLGSHADAVSLGELRQLARVLENEELCSCGQPVTACPWWSRALDRWDPEGAGHVQRLAELQARFERFRSTLRRFRPEGEAEGEYARLTLGLLRALREESGARLLVDSSKAPVRALALSRLAGLDLRVVHLVRDPRGVAWSMAKELARDVEAGVERSQSAVGARTAARDWLANNIYASKLVRRLGQARAITLRYEELVSQPETALTKLSSCLEIDLTKVARQAAGEGIERQVGHTLAGNRLRMKSGPLRLRPDLAWSEKLPRGDRRTVERWAGRWMKRYGYDR